MDGSLQRVARDYDERMARLNKVEGGKWKGCMYHVDIYDGCFVHSIRAKARNPMMPTHVPKK